jgi:hypothetical protein
VLLERSPKKRDRHLHEFADNIASSEDETLSVNIPAGTIELHWICDWVDDNYSVCGKLLTNPAYELILPPGVRGLLMFRSIEPIEIIFTSY